MLDHIGISVSDLKRRRTFYLAALKPAGYSLLMEFLAEVTGTVDVAGFGKAPKADFWLSQG